MHFASLIQRICKLIRPHLTAKENTRVGLLDSRSWWSHAPAAPGLTWTCHYPEERAANHPGPVRCIAVGLERQKATVESVDLVAPWRLLLLQQVVAKHLGNGRKRHVGMSQNTTQKI